MDPGTWTDHGETGVSSTTGSPYNAIDANLFIDGTTPYLTFGSFWTDIFQVRMNADATLADGEPYNVAFEPEGTHPLEGPFLFRWGDWTYLFYMWGICCGYDGTRPAPGEEYKVKVCRSEGADGPFVCVPSSGISVLVYSIRVVGVDKLVLMKCRSIRTVYPAQKAAGQSFSKAMIRFMDRVDCTLLFLPYFLWIWE